jgi:hypothetical protein
VIGFLRLRVGIPSGEPGLNVEPFPQGDLVARRPAFHGRQYRAAGVRPRFLRHQDQKGSDLDFLIEALRAVVSSKFEI